MKGFRAAEVSKLASRFWHAGGPALQGRYKRLAKEAAAQHSLQFPDYKYRPKKKGEKKKSQKQRKEEKVLAAIKKAQYGVREYNNGFASGTHINPYSVLAGAGPANSTVSTQIPYGLQQQHSAFTANDEAENVGLPLNDAIVSECDFLILHSFLFIFCY